MTCEPCRSTWARPERLEVYDIKQRGVLLHDSYTQLQCSMSGGCKLCQLLHTHVAVLIDEEKSNKHRDKILPESTLFKLHIGIHTTGAQTNHHSGSSTLLAHVEARGRFGKKTSDLFKHGWNGFFEVIIDRSVIYKPLSGSVTGRIVVQDPKSLSHVALLKSWIAECSEKHELCRIRLAQPHLPSRTIDVGPVDGSASPRLVLHERTEVQHLTWIALSHRWGKSIPIKTISSNLDAHQREIPFHSLPLTFQDAVTVTRLLGLRHLWIDSLCIVQDDAEDWLAEYPKMGSIFEQAQLTLAADNASDCNAGLLRPRISEEVLSFPWVSLDGRISSQIYVRKGLKAWKYALGERESSIHTRGWILQEDLLAPRTLHYGRQQVFWECRTHRRSESLSEPFRNFTDLNLTAGKSFMRLGPSTSGSKRTSKDPDLLVYSEWAVVVRDYTRRQLTYPTDKLPALVGAAQAFQCRLTTPMNGYYAGMWENNLHKDLLWRGKYSEPLIAVPGRAPSWSWASVDGAVLFPRHMGPARDGYLATIQREEPWPFTSPRHVPSHSLSTTLALSAPFITTHRFDCVSLDVPPGYNNNGIRLRSSDADLADVLCYFDARDAHTDELRKNPLGLACIAVARFIEGDRQATIMGLLLEPADDSSYRRIGTVRVEVPHDGSRDVQSSARAQQMLRGWDIRTIKIG